MTIVRRSPGASEVHIVGNAATLECIGCPLTSSPRRGVFTTATPTVMLTHLAEHRSHGHLVPQYAITRILRDAATGHAAA